MRGHGSLIEGLNTFLPEGFELQIREEDGNDDDDEDNNYSNDNNESSSDSSDDRTHSR